MESGIDALACFSRTRSPEDFRALVETTQESLYRAAQGILVDPALADDALQEVYLKLFREPERAANGPGGGAYLRRMAVNAALMALRSSKRRASYEEEAAMNAKSAAQETPSESAYRVEVRTAVDRLPDELRVPVVLHYEEGYSYAEVAETLAIPSGTVASRIHTAMPRLRAVLAGGLYALVPWSLEDALRSGASTGQPVPAPVTEKILRIPSECGRRAGSGGPRPGFPSTRQNPWVAPLIVLPVVAGVLVVVGLGVARFLSTSDGALRSPGSASAPVGARMDSRGATTQPAADGPRADGGAGSEAPPASGSRTDARVPPALPAVVDGFVLRIDGRISIQGRREALPGGWPGRGIPFLSEELARAWHDVTLPRAFPLPFDSQAAVEEGVILVYVHLRVLEEQALGPLEEASSAERSQMPPESLYRYFPRREIRRAECVGVEVVSDRWREAIVTAWHALGPLRGLLAEGDRSRRQEDLARLAEEARRAVGETVALRMESGPFPRVGKLESARNAHTWQVTATVGLLADARVLLEPIGYWDETWPPGEQQEECEGLADDLGQVASRAQFLRRAEELLGEFWREQTFYALIDPEQAAQDVGHATRLSLWEIAEIWTDEEFGAAREMAREAGRIIEERRGQPLARAEEVQAADARMQEWTRRALAGVGWTLEELPQGECALRGIVGALRVVGVEPGSAAAEAGVVAGDLLWRVENYHVGDLLWRTQNWRRARDFGAEGPFLEIRGVQWLADFVGSEGSEPAPKVTFEVLRGEDAVRVEIRRPHP